jgi:hypothetical protein
MIGLRGRIETNTFIIVCQSNLDQYEKNTREKHLLP